MTKPFQPRRLLLLEDPDESSIAEILGILRSPLSLAKILVCLSFQPPPNGLPSVRRTLDSIKRMAAGLTAAEAKAAYSVANYSTYLFSFQQFFHSSYRARQGNVLESAVRGILHDAGATVYSKAEHVKVMVGKLGIKTQEGHDVDVLASNTAEYLMIQIRSRDDTGGTTAKGSLVELPRAILSEKITPRSPIHYVVYIWEPLQSSQKKALVSKISQQLARLVNIPELESKLYDGKTVELSREIRLQVVYGEAEFSTMMSKFTENRDLEKIIARILGLATDWDDLWLSYALASLELERLVIGGKSNFELLIEFLREEGIEFSATDLSNYVAASEKYALRVMEHWTVGTLPVTSPLDVNNYVRDLVLLAMVHYKIQTDCNAELSRFAADQEGKDGH